MCTNAGFCLCRPGWSGTACQISGNPSSSLATSSETVFALSAAGPFTSNDPVSSQRHLAMETAGWIWRYRDSMMQQQSKGVALSADLHGSVNTLQLISILAAVVGSVFLLLTLFILHLRSRNLVSGLCKHNSHSVKSCHSRRPPCCLVLRRSFSRFNEHQDRKDALAHGLRPQGAPKANRNEAIVDDDEELGRPGRTPRAASRRRHSFDSSDRPGRKASWSKRRHHKKQVYAHDDGHDNDYDYKGNSLDGSVGLSNEDDEDDEVGEEEEEEEEERSTTNRADDEDTVSEGRWSGSVNGNSADRQRNMKERGPAKSGAKRDHYDRQKMNKTAKKKKKKSRKERWCPDWPLNDLSSHRHLSDREDTSDKKRLEEEASDEEGFGISNDRNQSGANAADRIIKFGNMPSYR
ncbi:unnamed protein product [Protopolystoma xenopodis]|uniref:EGF-like domain-containing protein n=1 Tax=Protopolystoma xenopodis TaxID=117903 RepID=A0A448WX92_9PLAT|nr:unnamed protein product [Protopolystoma xenopodis]